MKCMEFNKRSRECRIVESKSRIGDMEGDTIVGTRGGSKDCLLTLVDRKSKFCFIKRTLDKSAASIQIAMESVVKSGSRL